MEKKKVIVTGASGFVGRNFIEKYSDRYDIVPISLRTTKVEDIEFTNVDCVLHLAALVHQMKGAPEEKYFEINRDLTEKLAVRAKEKGVKHFVFYSTVGVWGTHGYFDHDRIITLETPTNPKTPYAKSKIEAEKILENLKGDIFKVSILRPPMIYGEGCPGNLPKLEKLVKIFSILPFNYSENKRTMIDINKLTEETNAIIKKEKKGIFIPKDQLDISIKEIIEKLAKKNNKKIKLIRLPKLVFNLIYRIKPKIVKSLYGSLRFK
ncbi:NAD-dependent epimerase/dehydratase family protein [Fusobacteria bacterium ZRK30]|nr:NAD-dependent epimerase/dehydratase family protein [Fusobacteria bacterium ZRK30]